MQKTLLIKKSKRGRVKDKKTDYKRIEYFLKGVCKLTHREYLLTDWGEYSIFVEAKYNENNEKLDFLRQIRYEIRVNNVYLKENNRPKSFDDIFKLTAYEDLGKSKKED